VFTPVNSPAGVNSHTFLFSTFSKIKIGISDRLFGIQAMPLAFAVHAIQDDLVSEGWMNLYGNALG
jgi:hypothetical protein